MTSTRNTHLMLFDALALMLSCSRVRSGDCVRVFAFIFLFGVPAGGSADVRDLPKSQRPVMSQRREFDV